MHGAHAISAGERLVLTGPRLPHNWVSLDLPEGGIAQRDLVIQFPHGPIAQAAAHIRELEEVLPLLDRARNGIEFFGLSEQATDRVTLHVSGNRSGHLKCQGAVAR